MSRRWGLWFLNSEYSKSSFRKLRQSSFKVTGLMKYWTTHSFKKAVFLVVVQWSCWPGCMQAAGSRTFSGYSFRSTLSQLSRFRYNEQELAVCCFNSFMCVLFLDLHEANRMLNPLNAFAGRRQNPRRLFLRQEVQRQKSRTENVPPSLLLSTCWTGPTSVSK